MLTIFLSVLLATAPNTVETAVQADTVDYIFYVDDNRVDPATAKAIKLADIKTITTIKGEAAIELYGAEARNGVVDIKTKMGVTKDSKQPLLSTKEKSAHEYVDLGLSVKWATCNIGAEKPEEFGNYYSWAEVEPKTSYTLTNYKFYMSGNSNNDVKFSKYSFDESNKKSFYNHYDQTNLFNDDDVACVKWGGNWRMPTKEEMDELRNNCSWTWIILNGVTGYKVTSMKSGYKDRYIFLPAAGYRDITNDNNVGSAGYYWSCSLRSGIYNCACNLYLSPGYWENDITYRYRGLTVRPVCP